MRHYWPKLHGIWKVLKYCISHEGHYSIASVHNSDEHEIVTALIKGCSDHKKIRITLVEVLTVGTTKRQDLFNLGLWFFPCIVGIACCLATSFYPMEFNIKNRAGENVGCITGDLDCQGKVNAHAPTAHNSKPISMHFRGMTLEQRRLGLVAALHYMSGNPNLLHGVGFGAGI